MRSKIFSFMIFLAALALCSGLLVGCGGDSESAESGSSGIFREKPVSSLKAADAHFVYITLADCYPLDRSVVAVADAANKMPTFFLSRAREKYYSIAQTLTYDEDLGGYGILLEEGRYEISLICNAEGVKYSQSRFISVDAEHSYYHVRFTERAFHKFE